jgi:hypothetical protein
MSDGHEELNHVGGNIGTYRGSAGEASLDVGAASVVAARDYRGVLSSAASAYDGARQGRHRRCQLVTRFTQVLADMHGPLTSRVRNQGLLLTPAPVSSCIFDAFLDYSLSQAP